MATGNKNLQIETDILKEALENLSEGIVMVDSEGRFLFVNQRAEEIVGMSGTDTRPGDWTSVYGCYLPDKISPYPSEQLPLARARRGEEVNDDVIFIRNPQKPTGRWISATSKPITNGDGSIRAGLVTFRDITALKEKEENLRSKSKSISAMVENQQAGILVEDENRRILQINEIFCQLFNIPTAPSELLGTDCSESAELAKQLFRDPEKFVDRIDRLLADRTTVLNEEIILADGRVLERDYIPIFVGREYRGQIWQYRDITDRLQARKSIQGYERLCSALQQTADSVVITDKKGVIEFVNPAFETTTGYCRDEALGKTPQILKSGLHDAAFYRNLWETILSGRPFNDTIVNRKKSGELYWSQQTITPMRDENGEITHFVTVLKDITELLKRKEREVEMRLAREVQQLYYGTTAVVPGYDIAGTSYPASETGGDYFDFITMTDERLCIVIGDVSGHGFSSALIMSETRAYVRAFAAAGLEIGEIFTQVNKALIADLKEGRFVTLLACCLDPRTRTMTFAGAGHVPGYLLGENGRIDTVLENTGPPLGLISNYKYSSRKVMLGKVPRVLLLMTDGIIESEAPDGDLFGEEQAIRHVVSQLNKPARHISESLYQATRAFAGGNTQRDDVTSIILKTI